MPSTRLPINRPKPPRLTPELRRRAERFLAGYDEEEHGGWSLSESLGGRPWDDPQTYIAQRLDEEAADADD